MSAAPLFERPAAGAPKAPRKPDCVALLRAAAEANGFACFPSHGREWLLRRGEDRIWAIPGEARLVVTNVTLGCRGAGRIELAYDQALAAAEGGAS